MDRIMYLESQKSPVESLRKHCSETFSVEELYKQVACDWKSTCKRHVHCAVIDQFFYHSFYFVSFNKI